MQMHSALRVPVVVALTWLALAGAACDQVELTAPSGSKITLYATPSTIPVNGSAEILASVMESAGTPVANGTVVTFTTTLGSLDAREAKTQDGKATVRLFAGAATGTAKVSAFSGSTSAEAIEVTIQ